MYTKHILLSFFVATFAFSISAQIVTIPNPIFKNYLVNNSAINTNSDTEIQLTEASAYTGTINVFNLGINDLTGIEAFTGITGLNCNNNQISSLNLATNTALTSVTCNLNNMTSLNVSACTALSSLTCTSNGLTSINLSSNVQLTSLNLGQNNLTSLDLSSNTNLTTISLGNNSISALDLTSNTSLQTLTLNGNQMTSLILPATPTLWYLDCIINNLTSLNVSGCTGLTNLVAYNNQLQTIDLTNNPLLQEVLLMVNQLTYVNIASGGNTNVTWFAAQSNPNLTCIQVDNAAYSTANWTDIDAGANFSECCAGSSAGTDTHIVCGPNFQWIDGNSYSSNNTSATHIVPNSAGCDSVITLNLTLLPVSNTVDQRAGCAPFTWIDGNDYFTSNNTATHTLTGVNGCDSIITLNLTIGPYTYAANEVVTACDEYTWIDGVTYTSSTNTAQITFQALNFCDSTIYLDLTINSVDKTITNNSPILTANAVGASYQWIDCGNGNSPILGANSATFTASSNGTYACIIDDGTCSGTSDCIPVSNVGTIDLVGEFVHIYPNPTKNTLQIEAPIPIESVEVYTLTGEKIMTSATTEFSLEAFPNGVYLFVIVSEHGRYQQRVIKY